MMIKLGNGWYITKDQESLLLCNGYIAASYQPDSDKVVTEYTFKRTQYNYIKYFTAFRMFCLKDKLKTNG